MARDRKADLPDAELEDIDVREVSIVDRPAIKRKFLIVKSRDARLGVIRLEDQMFEEDQIGDEELTDEELLEVLKDEDEGSILDVIEDAEQEEPEQGGDVQEDPESVEKSLKTDSVKQATAITARLMSLVTKLKGLAKQEGDKLPDAITNEIRSVVQAVTAMVAKLTKGSPAPAKKGDEQAGKQEPRMVAGAVKIATAALERMMSVVNRLKELDDAAQEVPAAIVNELRGIATELNRVVSRYGYPAKSKEKEEEKEGEKEKAKKDDEPTIKAFVCKDGDDPEIIIVDKAGAKMKRSRLSAFEKAVETLMSLLKEIKGEQDNGSKKTTKREGAMKPDNAVSETTKEWMDTITKQIADLSAKFDEALSSLTGKLDTVSKRVDELDTTSPAGEGGTDPAPVESVKKSFWGGRIYR